MIVMDYVKKIKDNSSNRVNFQGALAEARERAFDSKEEIMSQFDSINVKQKDNLIHLKYNTQLMFKNPWNDFYMKVRSLVLDWVNEEIVLYPFDKFFELDEHETTKLEVVANHYKRTKMIEITEKIDGSLIVMRYYRGNFLIASSGSLEGPHVEIARRILMKDTSLKNFIKEKENYTFMLEMKNCEIPQLIKYKEDNLIIIGMRDMSNFNLLSISEINEMVINKGINVTPMFKLGFEEMLEIMEETEMSNNEGYIVRMDNLLVKMKTKNFIMANRFGGDPARNFNMVIKAINEGRVEAIRPMIRIEYTEAFDVLVKTILNFVKEKEENLLDVYEDISKISDMKEFINEAKKRLPDGVNDLIAIKKDFYQHLSKDDIKFLKNYSEAFTCVSHFKYAELNDLEVEDVMRDIQIGKIKYLKKFRDNYNETDIYIIHKWQWLNFDEIKPR